MTFRNYFITAQLCAGLAMAVRMSFEGIKEGRVSGENPWLSGLVWAIGGFLVVIPIAALIAAIQAAVSRWRSRGPQEPHVP